MIGRVTWMACAVLVFGLGLHFGDETSRSLRNPQLAGDYGDISGWTLNSNSGEANPPLRLSFVDGNQDVLEARMEKNYSRIWDIQLSRRGFAIEKGKRYTLSYRLRCERPTTVMLVINQSQPPWSNLGVLDQVPVREEWIEHAYEFEATQTNDNATVQLNMGTSAAPNRFWLTNLRLRPNLAVENPLR
ncbi:carbohydrate binding domain-containing protein [bacterium]|nr:carbohydrate binding domain-containing protein [bacterium]